MSEMLDRRVEFEWREVGDDDWGSVKGFDAEDAALMAAEAVDEEHWLASSGREVEVEIRNAVGQVTRWRVSAEPTVSYRAAPTP